MTLLLWQQIINLDLKLNLIDHQLHSTFWIHQKLLDQICNCQDMNDNQINLLQQWKNMQWRQGTAISNLRKCRHVTSSSAVSFKSGIAQAEDNAFWHLPPNYHLKSRKRMNQWNWLPIIYRFSTKLSSLWEKAKSKNDNNGSSSKKNMHWGKIRKRSCNNQHCNNQSCNNCSNHSKKKYKIMAHVCCTTILNILGKILVEPKWIQFPWKQP